MARKATSGASGKRSGSGGARKGKSGGTRGASKPSRALATTSGRTAQDSGGAGDAFIKLLQSPLVADLLAVAATAALAALAEHGFSSRGAGDGRRAGRAVKEAGKAAAAAIGRRLSTEIEEIRKVSKAKAGGAA